MSATRGVLPDHVRGRSGHTGSQRDRPMRHQGEVKGRGCQCQSPRPSPRADPHLSHTHTRARTHTCTHTHTYMYTHMPGPGLSLLEHQGLGWDQYREHLCSVINGQATSAGGRGLSTLSATRGSLLRDPLPYSGESQGCQLASHELQLRTVTAGCQIKPVAPPTVHTASCPEPPGALQMSLKKTML